MTEGEPMAKGRKTGGRTKGAPNKRTSEAAALAAALASDGASPLEVMLACMRRAVEQGDARLACDFASKAAPYMHARLSSIELDLKDLSNDELRNAAR